ncbi:putative bacteriocin export ABC transporter [Periweissella fabaria]|uniref:Macrolide export ATP-binding/permease protein MacB n=1 Tax=Periweissella fabaria TaxID=546157 RepID=A0ABN8BLI0_9LACO|nr:putative bacteriocin export ABC transporter [Periweissella fabaria]MCM0597207.1 putative bacteriocin export ABC transporter [Periweissella fabaria]CAH0416287.1 Macrolide export ATP-binding/permease protein MacB [Periweissella fabaria]
MKIELKSIDKAYQKRTVIKNFNLTVQDGQFIAIVGPSGSGKSTLLNILGLFESPDNGVYLINGQPAPKINSAASNKFIRQNINYLFQNFALIEDMSVYKNLEMALKYVPGTKNQKRKQIQEALEKVNMNKREDDLVATLSGGEQQRISVARAILKPGDLILADEPTASLDEMNRDIVFNLLTSLNQHGKTIIVVTHDQSIAEKIPTIIKIGSKSTGTDEPKIE